MQPRFLSLARVLRLHRSSILKYGGEPSVRDMGLLESAIAQPRAAFGGEFLHEDLAAMAAAYLFHVVSNHAFVDGNKRTGALAAYVFLKMNDVELKAPEKKFEAIVRGVARAEVSKAQVTDFIRSNI